MLGLPRSNSLFVFLCPKIQLFAIFAVLLCVLALHPTSLHAQSASSTNIAGVVSDSSGAVVADANVKLTDKATNTPRSTVTNDSGRYFFANVISGDYEIAVSKTGFRITKTVVTANVGVPLTVDLKLELGSVAETVEVTATNSELQTMNATVGNTISGAALDSLPSLGRDVSTFVTLQPGVTPDGSVAGAVYDQNSFSLDGGQNTNDMDGSMNIYTPSFAGDPTGGTVSKQFTGNQGGGPTGVMPTPADSIEEFKVGTTNQTADFNSSAGSEVQMVTKRGTNAWHGTVYEYYLDNNFSANTFDNNAHAGTPADPKIPVPNYHYNRFGGAIGGPILPKNILGGKTYFFANYQGFRWGNSETINRAVPTDSMRLGLLYFGGKYFNLNPTAVTYQGVTYPGTTLDPRGIGINPLVQQLWSKMPEPTNFNCGGVITRCDTNAAGLGNIADFTANMAIPQTDNFGVARLDHDFGAKWHFMSSYRYYKLTRATDSQYDIGGVLAGSLGKPTSLSSRPQVPWFLVAGLTTNITSNTTNDFHISYLRNYWSWASAADPPQISGLGGALEPLGEQSAAGGFALTPYNVNTQSTRTRFWDGHDTMLRDDVSVLKGNHLFQFGGTYQRNWDYHQRTDNGGGINYQPVYQLGTTSGSGITGLPAGLTGKTASRDYAAALGIVSVAQTAFTRTGANLALNPPLTPASDKSTIPYYNVYFSDSWHMKPSFTLTYGLGWTLEMPPVEQSGKQVELVDQAGVQIDTLAYLKQRETAALQGQVYNPEVGFALVGNTGNGQKYPYDPYYGAFSPRIAAAWNPGFDSGILGKAFGHGKTVVRGGYSRIFGRLNGVDLVLVPLLGTGLIQPVQCFGPLKDGVTCAGSGVATPLNAFRVGTDGLVAPIPSASATLPQPDFPGYNAIAAGAGEALDKNFRPNQSDQFDLTIQRQLTNKVMVEVGYIGRRLTHEYQPVNINTVPYMMTVGGQRFDKAYGAVVTQYCGGAAGLAANGCALNAGAVTPQPFFEKALAGTGYCTGFSSCTAAVVANEGGPGGNLTSQNVWTLWSDLDNGGFNFPRTMMNTPIATSAFGANGQLTSGVGVNASIGHGNYNALFATVKMSSWHGLTMQQNFTWGKAMGTGAVVQATSAYTLVDPFDINRSYGLQNWDRKFVYNVFFVYEPEVFKGQHGFLGRVLGGWTFAPILSAASGLPLEINTLNGDAQAFGEADGVNFFSYENGILNSAYTAGSSRHNNVPGGTDANGNSVGTSGFGANLFADPLAVWNSVRNPILGVDNRTGGAGVIRGLPFWNVDFSVKKNIHITERFSAEFQTIFTNVFNHDQLADPVLDLSNSAGWGVLGGQLNTPRQMEFGLRVRF
jgi:hypothetical protein